MIQLTKKEIQNLKPLNNKVLIKPSRKAHEIYLQKADKTLMLDPSFEPNKHTPVTGEIIALPTHAISTSKQFGWRCDVTAHIGDTACFSYLASIQAFSPRENEVIFDEDNNLYIWVDYQDIYCVMGYISEQITAKELIDIYRQTGSFISQPDTKYMICLNHFHLIEIVKSKIKTTVELPDHLKHLSSNTIAKIIYAPIKKVEYLADTLPQGMIAKPGSYVVFQDKSDFSLEYDLHRSFFGRTEDVRVITQRDILAIVPEDLIEQGLVK